MKKGLIISSFPAPYRVSVFERMAAEYNLDVFFCSGSDENRNSDWFKKTTKLNFYILGKKETDNEFNMALKHIKEYDFVMPYDAASKYAFKAIILCKLKKIPYFVNCDGAFIHRNYIKDLIKRFIFKGATGCFSSGKFASNYFRHYGVSEAQIFEHRFTSLNSSDILKFPINAKEKAYRRKKLGLFDCKTIITVGQFIHRKGFDILLEAWTAFSDMNCQLLIIGGGDEESLYRNYIEEHKMKNVIIKGFMQKQDLFEYYKASDIFILPTREDIWGLVINEAMACGLPVITTDSCIAGLELIKNDVNGYIVKSGEPNDLIMYLRKLLDNDLLCMQISKNNICLSQECTIENIAINHIKVINAALNKV